MISSKLIYHDIHYGLCRWRYLFIPFLIFLPLLSFYSIIETNQFTVTWMDIFCYLFKGINPIPSHSSLREKIEIPTQWIFVFGCSMIMNLDYIIQDLTKSGQQIIVRCGYRKNWFLSKCIWCVASSLYYFALIAALVTLYSILTGSKLSCSVTQDLWSKHFGIGNIDQLTRCQMILSGVILPALTLITINLLEMVLCLFVKPIFSFLSCLSVLMLVIWIDSDLILGCGGMVVRNVATCSQGCGLFTRSIMVFVYSITFIILGCFYFQRMNILPRED